MKKFLPILLLVIAIIFSGCASKRMAKRGLKFEEAGMYEMAADFFYKSMTANPKNVDAAVGLKRNGQRVMDEKSLQVHKAYFDGNDKQTVYSFLDTKSYLGKVNRLGIKLYLSETTQSYYDEARPRYLQSLYNEARILLDEEKFRESEGKFAEIKRIDPSYQGIDEHMRMAVAELIYREGYSYLESGFNRKAYHSFSNIIANQGTYKDAKELRDEALSKALITISIGDIKNHTRSDKANLLVESTVVSAINDLGNPFVKIVDTKNTDRFVEQQVRGVSMGSDLKVGQILAAKAVLNGSVLKHNLVTGRVQKSEQRGYLKEIVTVKDKVTDEETKETRYTKVTYEIISARNEASISFQYQLTSIETGAVLVTDAINHSKTDRVSFANFSGDHKKLVPGNWESATKDSPKDRIDDNHSAISNLRNKLNAKRTIKSAQALQTEMLDEVGQRVAQKIDVYNPEE
ncbi:MAG TPA: hypothetical protein DG754_05050 [Bacteroidales bacterium]|nr:hypothetical protein [Bacteroidales bacterium]